MRSGSSSGSRSGSGSSSSSDFYFDGDSCNREGANICTARSGDFYLNGGSCSREGANICAERSGDFYLNGDSGHSAKGGTAVRMALSADEPCSAKAVLAAGEQNDEFQPL